MGNENRELPKAEMIGRVVRAIERQVERERRQQSSEMNFQEQQFFRLLDRLEGPLFIAIGDAIRNNHRMYYMNALPNFRADCDRIFAKGFGDFPSNLVNRWLHSRDLKHVFHCHGNTIEW